MSSFAFLRKRALRAWFPRALTATALAACAACTGTFELPNTPSGPEGSRPACTDLSSELELTPGSVSAGTGQILIFRATGGTGAYRFTLLTNASGGQIDASNGVYIAGEVAEGGEETVDLVSVSDLGCTGEAGARVVVVEAPSILPARAEIAPGGSIAFEGVGGSGSYRFELLRNETGATLDGAGRYTAGASEGRDKIALFDDALGVEVESNIDVRAGAGLSMVTGRWLIPLGSSALLPIEGGSGSYRITPGDPSLVEIDGAHVTGLVAGAADLAVVDRYTGASLSLEFEVIAPLEAPRPLAPDRLTTHDVYPAMDIDGDGFMDVVAAMPQGSVGGHGSGALMIFRGGATGLAATPSRVLVGPSREAELGRGVAFGDIDGDGLVDMAVGTPRADPTGTDEGRVEIYLGVEGQLFAEEPALELIGQVGFDRFGASLALCDFNGDGNMDIAVGVPSSEDRSREMVASAQGGVALFLGYGRGRFTTNPDSQIWGVLPDGAGGWYTGANLRFGESIAAGDFNGDGLCDLAVHSVRSPDLDRDNGSVSVHLGREPDASSRGGLQALPSLVWAHDVDTNDREFGYGLQMGDLNGDGRADVVAGHWTYDVDDATGDAGALFVFTGRALGPEPAASVEPVLSGAAWSVFGDQSSVHLGRRVSIADVDGDGRLDLISGDPRANMADSELSRPGAVRVYRGRSGSLPDTTPSREHFGVDSDAYFGLGVSSAGDQNGDDVAELLIFAPFDDQAEDGDDLGRLYLQPPTGAPRALEPPRSSASQRVGSAVAWLGDLDGDGYPELAVGATTADRHASADDGFVYIYRGTAGGVEASPAQTLDSTAGVATTSDGLGYALAGGADFDGDGIRDLVVSASGDDIETSFNDTRFALDPSCAGYPTERINGVGFVWVFRGRAGGLLEETPAFAYYGVQVNQGIRGEIDVGDINGDGRDDFVAGAIDLDIPGLFNVGGASVVFGRAPSGDGRPLLICAADHEIIGEDGNDLLGRGVAVIGDVDGDGCAEWALGSPETDRNGRVNTGMIRVYSGFGPTCARATPREVDLVNNTNQARAGSSLAGGVDLDRDGSPDLLVGVPRFQDGRGEIGRVVVVLSGRLRSLIAAGGAASLIDPTSTRRLTVDGLSPGDRLGDSVAMALWGGGDPMLVLGSPFGAASGTPNTGGLLLFSFSASQGISAAPVAILSGETFAGEGSHNEEGGTLGSAVAVHRQGSSNWIAAGAPFSSAAAVDDGAAYAFSFAR